MNLFGYNIAFRSPVVISKVPTFFYRLDIWYKGSHWNEQFKPMTEKQALQLLATQSERFKSWDSHETDSVDLQRLNEETMEWEGVEGEVFGVATQLVSYRIKL